MNQPTKIPTQGLHISEETWRLVDERVSMRRYPGQDQRLLQQLGRAIRESLKEDRQRRVTTEGEEVEILLTGDPPPPPRSLEEDVGVVQRGGGPRPAARSNHA